MIRKKELIQYVTQHTTQPTQAVKEIIETTFDALCTMLENHESIHIVNFGTLKTKKRAKRVGRDPNTGKPIPLPEMYQPVFIASTQLKNRIKGNA